MHPPTTATPTPPPVDADVPMRDGVVLRADVYARDDGAARPVLLLRSPYDRRSPVTLVMFDLARALARGYAVVVQDTRGRYASEGTFLPFRPDIEDGYDTIDWVARQPFCDGAVVMAGSSYLGATAWLAALSSHPALKAIAPALTASDYHEGWTHQGGAFQLAFNLFWALVHLAPEERRRRGIAEPAPAAPVYRRATSAGDTDWPAARASSAVAGAWLSHRPLGDVPPLRDVGDFYFDWLEHDAPDAAYWEAISPERNAARVCCAVLCIAGWYQLFLRGAYEGLRAVSAAGATEAARRRSALILGPWENSVPGPSNTTAGELDFGSAAGIDFEGAQLDFFDAVLGRAAHEIPRVRYFTMGSGVWRTAGEWPPRGTAWTPWYAGPDGTLASAVPEVEEAWDETRFDPADPAPTLGGTTVPGLPQGPRDHRALLGRADVAVYASAPLPAAVEITGPVRAIVHADSTAETFDVVVALTWEDADGRLLNLCDGIVRVAPGASGPVEVDLLATSVELPAGTRVLLVVHHSNHPRFDVNPGVAGHRALVREQRASVQRIHRSSARATRVLLPLAGMS